MSRRGSASWLDQLLVASLCLGLLAGPLVARGSKLVPIATALVVQNGGSAGAAGANSHNETSRVPVKSSLLQADAPTLDQDDEASNSTTLLCDEARIKCAYRTGCGRALQHYLNRCATVLQGDVRSCPEFCQIALVGLMSSDEGKDLVDCKCQAHDQLCLRSRARAEVCRPAVTATLSRTRVSCRVATWICIADSLCSTALAYYNENCKRMFQGKKCTKRCRNSINILRRQEKASRLNNCYCDGAEDYDCLSIHRNMNDLCYAKPSKRRNYELINNTTTVEDDGTSPKDNEVDKSPNRADDHSVSASWRILLLGLVFLLHAIILGE